MTNFETEKNGLGLACVTQPMEKPLKNEGFMLEFKPGVENFYDTVEVYADQSISADEIEYVRQKVIEAAEYTAAIASGYFGIANKYDRIRLFYRPFCLSGQKEELGGYAGAGYIVISPAMPGCSYKEREALVDEKYSFSFVSMLVHEMMHLYLFPRLHEDPSLILEEGVNIYLQRMLANNYGGYNWSDEVHFYTLEQHEAFPEKPIEPIFEEAIYEGFEGVVVDVYGNEHNVAVHQILEDGHVDIDADGKNLGSLMREGACVEDKGNNSYYNWEPGYAYCIAEENGDYNLIGFSFLDRIIRTMAVTHKYSKTEPGIVEYSLAGIYWGYNGFGSDTVFVSDGVDGYGDISYNFDQSADVLASPFEYEAAYFLHTGLQSLYWKTHAGEVGFHPDDYLMKLGAMHEDYFNYLYSDKPTQYTGDTNIYQEICGFMELPIDECYGVYYLFGLDENVFPKFSKKAICPPIFEDPLPPDNEADASGEDDYMEGPSGDGGCSASPMRPSSLGVMIESAFKNAADQYSYLFR